MFGSSTTSTEDFSLTNDLASENPEKLKELQDLFEKEAIANNVYPLDDRSVRALQCGYRGTAGLDG